LFKTPFSNIVQLNKCSDAQDISLITFLTVLFKTVFKTIISFVQNVRFFGQKDKMKTLATLCIWAA